MCVSTGPAHFAATRIYGGIAERRGQTVHVLGYQNIADNLSDKPNCMVLHIPSASPMSHENMVDATDCPDVLDDIKEAVTERTRGGGVMMAGGSRSAKGFVEIFKKGIYTVVLTNKPRLAATALKTLPDDIRPTIPVRILRFYQQYFPGWHLALCCFNLSRKTEATPLVWWYEPLYPKYLMAPALDAHDGNPPDFRKGVDVDHQVTFGTCKEGRTLVPVRRSFEKKRYPSEIRELLPKRGFTQLFLGRLTNGDFFINTKDLDSVRPPVYRGVINDTGNADTVQRGRR